MTTNFTAILNQNLDQIPGYDFPADMIELEDGSIVTRDEYDFIVYREYEGECEDEGPSDEDFELLHELMETLTRLAAEKGEDSDEYRDCASFYSDVYKDVFGSRPRW